MVDEGYTKFNLNWTRHPPFRHDQIQDLIKWRKHLWFAGLIGYDADDKVGYGNMSARIGNQFVVSGTQTGILRNTNANHWSLVQGYSFEDNRVDCTGPVAASSESLTHAALYELDLSILAVVHGHSRDIWRRLLHRIPTTDPKVAYGTPEMAQELRRLYEESAWFREEGVVIMAGHQDGVIAFGATIGQAAKRILDLVIDDHT